jgi:hypothetical protein
MIKKECERGGEQFVAPSYCLPLSVLSRVSP